MLISAAFEKETEHLWINNHISQAYNLLFHFWLLEGRPSQDSPEWRGEKPQQKAEENKQQRRSNQAPQARQRPQSQKVQARRQRQG